MKNITKIVFLIILFVVLFVCGYFLFTKYFSNGGFFSDDNNSMPSPNLVGGCGGVYYPYQQRCCDSWAKDNNLVHTSCIGNWTVENNVCTWNCRENQNPAKKINTQVTNDSTSSNDSVIPRDVCGLDNNGKLVCS